MSAERLLLSALAAVILVLAGIVLGDDGMTRCELTHSFDTCHDALH